MAMDVSTVAIDVGQYPEQATLQSLISKIKHHNLLDLKIQLGTSPTNEVKKVVWTLDKPEESSLRSFIDLFKCLRNDDTNFSSDDNTQSNVTKNNKLMRSKSLRSALRTPSTPNLGMRKTVHFADSFGLDLVHQNYYEADDFSVELQKFGATFPPLSTKIIKRPRNVMLTLAKFHERTDAEIDYLTRNQAVCLECVKFVDMNIIGTINVLNIAYEKQVYIRYTTDNWRTNIETIGRYKSSVTNDDTIDKFTFIISLPTDFPLGATCEFCIRYIVNGITYWDNNKRANYIVEAVGNIPIDMKLIAKTFKLSKNTHNQQMIKD
ncbi:putative phosphatase regulatory subunit family protein [Brugia pahangi]